jgi:tetratricopeptide (TPR) repeat protein
MWHLARGCARAGKGQLKEAADEKAAMEQAFSALPEGRAFGAFFNDWSTLHALAADELAARIETARGNLDAAVGHWRHAVSVEDQMNFDDVPDWYYPVRESLGGALLRNKQAPEAEQVFRDDLKRNPRNPRSLFGLSRALEAQQKTSQADEVRESFEGAWKGKEQPRLEDL